MRTLVLLSSQIPRFAFEDEPLADVAGRFAISLAGLISPTLILGFAGVRRLRRYPVIS
jgi:hypothetical protein